VVLPITVARAKSLTAINAATAKRDNFIGVVAQKEAKTEDPGASEIHTVGTLAKIVKQIKMPDGNTTLFIMGRIRFEVIKFIQSEPYLTAEVRYLDDDFPNEDQEFDAMIASVKDMAESIIELSPNLPSETGMMLRNIENFSFIVHFIAYHLDTKLGEMQAMLEQIDI